MAVKEKPFPRGGNRPAFDKRKKSSFSLFGRLKTKTKKKSKKDKKKENEVVANHKFTKEPKSFPIKFVEELNSSGVKEGMFLLGILSQVTDKILSVSLPGNLRGIVTLVNVSEFYRNLIENMTQDSEVPSLKDIFEPGDIFPFKVITVSDKDSALILTCDPKLINSKLTYDVIQEGLILWGNVKSEEDHGYIIDFGIAQTYSFLNFNKIKNKSNLKVGQIVRCAIIHCKKSVGSCSVQVSVLEEDFSTAFISINSSFSMLFYLPGFQFEVLVTKILKNGLEVSYGNGGDSFKGYIHEEQLPNKFPDLSKIAIGTQYVATLLYVKSLVNIPYFKVMPKNKPIWPFQFGEIVKGKIIKAKKNGLIVRVFDGERKAKCFIPLSKVQGAKKLLEGETSVDNLYPVDKKLNKIRLGNSNYMGRFYFGATDKESLEEKYYSVTDLKCGEIVSGVISSFTDKMAYILIGKSIRGIVRFNDMTDVPMKNPLTRFKVGQCVKTRVMEIKPEIKYVRLTMKPTLLKEKRILSNHNFKSDKTYLGVIQKVLNGRLIVKFFNGIIGTVPKCFTPYPDVASLKKHFAVGYLVKCYVLRVDKDDTLALSLLNNKYGKMLKVGQKYDATIVNKSNKALLLDISLDEERTCTGYLPKELLTIHKKLTKLLLDTYLVGDKLSVYCVLNEDKSGLPVMGVLEIFEKFFEELAKGDQEKPMKIGYIMPFLYRSKSSKLNKNFLYNIVPQKTNYSVRVIRGDFQENENSKVPVFSRYELLYGKILRLTENKIDVSIMISDVWDKDLNTTLFFLDSYLQAIDRIVDFQKAHLKKFSETATIEHIVSGNIEEVRSNNAIMKTNDGDIGLVEGKFTVGQTINGIIAWIDVFEKIFHISANFSGGFEFATKNIEFNTKCSKVYGKVVFFNRDIIVFQLRGRGKGKLAFMPRRRHLNDFETLECPFSIGDEILLQIFVLKSKYWLAIDNRVYAAQQKLELKKAKNKLQESIVLLKRKLISEKLERNKKRKMESESEDLEVVEAKINKDENEMKEDAVVPAIKQEIDFDEGDAVYDNAYNDIPHLEYDDVEVKSENDDNETSGPKFENEEKILLSSSSDSEEENDVSLEKFKPFEVGFNWEVMKNKSLLSGAILNKDETTSDDEEEKTKNEKKKRRKLTESEKIEKAKTEEQRLRLIEERLMDSDREPETVDDFDRAVLANPDSSALWLKYMAFHIQNTEIEEARTVARRALKAISFREEQEKLNIWIAFLNLENLYGSEESLGKILKEALQYNEPYKIHLHMLNLNGKNGKFQEMERLGNYMLKKYKDVENMWTEVGTEYYLVGRIEAARLVLQRAVTILPKKQHIMIISKFAQLENKYGSPERAQTLYETILSSFPKRVDIWSCYVDMLVKSKNIDLARQVLQRAVSQSLRPRKMKILFKKFLTFEETHGTPENVEKVREAAVEYVETVGSLNKS